MKGKTLQPKSTKPFFTDDDDEEFASVCHFGSSTGPLIVDVNMATFTAKEARRLSAWLLKAAAEVEAYNKSSKSNVTDD